MPANKLLTENEITELAWAVYLGTASEVEAEQLLLQFVRYFDSIERMPKDLMGHIRDCIALYLQDASTPTRSSADVKKRRPKTLDQAFGLGKVRGRPRGSVKVDWLHVAQLVVEEILNGKSLQNAEKLAASKFDVSEKMVRINLKRDAYEGMCLAERDRKKGLSKEQKKRLREEFLQPLGMCSDDAFYED